MFLIASFVSAWHTADFFYCTVVVIGGCMVKIIAITVTLRHYNSSVRGDFYQVRDYQPTIKYF
jgi:hypothetical protein